jgi:hypothetical protein
MPNIHTITKDNGSRAEVGDFRFTMRVGELLPGVLSPVNTPCWKCQEPIRAGEQYHLVAVWHPGNLYSDAALIHSRHVD